MKKFFLTVLVALSLGAVAFAQEEAPTMAKAGSHLTIGVNGSYGGLWLKGTQTGVTKLGFGMGGDLSYAYFFTNHVGIRVGVGAELISSGFRSSEAVVSEGSCLVHYAGSTTPLNANYWYSTPNVQENYESLYGMVPIQLALQGNHWYANLGVKLAIPVRVRCADYDYDATEVYYKGSVKASAGVPTGYIPDGTVAEQTGSYTIYNFRADNNLVNPFFVMGAAELGYRFGCDCGHSWQIGCFADIAINAATPESEHTGLLYATDGTNSGNHHYTNGVMRTDLVNTFRLVNFGLKLSYDFSLSK